MVNSNKQATAIAFEMARDDPELVLLKISELRQQGEVRPTDLRHIERVATAWMEVTSRNLMRAVCSAQADRSLPHSPEFESVRFFSEAVVHSLFPTVSSKVWGR